MTYARAREWVAYQPFLPAGLRCDGEREPVEEFWAWDGHQVHLDRHVDEQAPVKLALHGGGGDGRLLASVGIAARGAAETVAPDLPGYGHTRFAGSPYTYGDWVACVRALVEAEAARDGRPIVLFGASMGGMLAYDVAAHAPAVRGVIATCLLEPRDPQVRRAVVRHPALAYGIPLLVALGPFLGGLRVPVGGSRTSVASPTTRHWRPPVSRSRGLWQSGAAVVPGDLVAVGAPHSAGTVHQARAAGAPG